MMPRLLLAFSVSFSALAAAASSSAPLLNVAKGFAVEEVYRVPRETHGSWISLTADSSGRLITSDQYGPLYRITLSASDARQISVARIPLAFGGAHGFAWVGSDLYAVGGQKAVAAPGLYRLRDTNRDGEFDEAQLLRALEGDGEHGPHAVVVAPDGRSLYVIAGNGTRRPELARSRVPAYWGEDALLAPLPAIVGSETRGHLGGGWVGRTDLDGREWELVASGMRNAYALAVDPRGELFTFDSDTEFEINLPWYRPTRVLHLVSGADYGWRRGIFKVPETAPDGWPALLPLGLGSPTAVLFPHNAQIPPSYRRALWVADWSYGKLYAIHLRPVGSTFVARAETIVSGTPLPITAACVDPVDGALYFVTGGRRTGSALYRVKWVGSDSTPETRNVAQDVAPETRLRHTLETFHGRSDPNAVATAWPHLASDDPLIRRAARTALESQPVEKWRDRALTEPAPRLALAALLALARIDARAQQEDILKALRRHLTEKREDPLPSEVLRVLTLTLARAGNVSADARRDWATLLEKTFPAPTPSGQLPELLELLVALETPSAMTRTFAALRTAASREAQLNLARLARARPSAWSSSQRRQYFEWLAATASWRGGASFTLFLKNLRAEALALATPAERALLEASSTPQTAGTTSSRLTGASSHRWTVDELLPVVSRPGNSAAIRRGKEAFAAASCFACHTFAGEGGAVGPDLTGVASRLSPRDMLEAILEPSREISDQYGTVEITLRDGTKHSGRIVNITEQGLQLARDLFDPANTLRIAESSIASIQPSALSLMPPGLLDTLSAEVIGDLLAFLRSDTSSR